LKYFW